MPLFTALVHTHNHTVARARDRTIDKKKTA